MLPASGSICKRFYVHSNLVSPLGTFLFLPLYLLFSLSFPTSPAPESYTFPKHEFFIYRAFSEGQLAIIKEKKIRRVEVRTGEEEDQFFYFNGQGQLQSLEWIKRRRKKNIITATVSYFYDGEGRLSVARWNRGKEFRGIDSVAFDKKGRVIHRTSQNWYGRPLKKYLGDSTLVTWQLVASSNEGLVLATSNPSSGDSMYYSLNNQNEITKVINGSRIDSIAIETQANDCYLKKYYFKKTDTAAWRVGREDVYRNKLLKKTVNYGFAYGDRRILSETQYEHNATGQLIYEVRSPIGMDRKFTVYNEFGLIAEKFHYSRGRMNRVHYQYLYR